MTRKDYIALARAFADSQPAFADSPEYNAWRDTLDAVSEVLQADNPRFDRYRFQHAASDDRQEVGQ